MILGIGIAVIVIGVGVVIAVILWAGARERGNARRARFTKS